MVNSLTIYNKLLHWLMKLVVGVRSRAIEIEPGTVLNFWVPNETTTETKRYKPAVVFLHGFCANDFLFFGNSTTDKTERSVEFQAECIAKGLKKLGVERCTLVEFSYGGFVSFQMAEMHPDLIQSVVVTASVIALTDSISKAGLQRIGFSCWTDYLLPDSDKGLRMLSQNAAYKLPWIPHRIYKDFLKSIHILWGKDDKLLDLDAAHNMIKQLGENATLHFIEKSGHLAHLKRPFVFNSLLKRILVSFLLQDNAVS